MNKRVGDERMGVIFRRVVEGRLEFSKVRPYPSFVTW